MKSLISQDTSTSPSPPTSSSHLQLLTASILPGSSGPPINLLVSGSFTSSQISSSILFQAAEGASAADQMAALLGPGSGGENIFNISKIFPPDQMAALLGPSWKSRQPRMCQYCQRMFSNKFNLKQVKLLTRLVNQTVSLSSCQVHFQYWRLN